MTMLSPLVIKGLRALRSDEVEPPATPPPAAAPTPMPPFFSVEMPWINQHLVNIDANQQSILHMLRDENGRNRIMDILDRQDTAARRLDRIERLARTQTSRKKDA